MVIIMSNNSDQSSPIIIGSSGESSSNAPNDNSRAQSSTKTSRPSSSGSNTRPTQKKAANIESPLIIHPTNPCLPANHETTLSLFFSENLDSPFTPGDDSSVSTSLFNELEYIIDILGDNGIELPENDADLVSYEDMDTSNRGGNYIICDPSKMKNGRCTRFSSTKRDRYDGLALTKILTIYDIYDSNHLDDLELFIIEDVYNALKEDEGEDLSTCSGMKSYYKRTGIVPMLRKLIGNIKSYSWDKRGVRKALILNFEEIAIFKKLQESGVLPATYNNPMESLHGNHINVWGEAIKSMNTKSVVMLQLMKRLMFGKDAKSFTWINLKNVASWAPDIGGFTEDLGDGECAIPEGLRDIVARNIDNIEEMKNAINELLEESIELDHLDNDMDVDEIITAVMSGGGVGGGGDGGGDDNENAIVIVTKYIYYYLSGGKDDTFFDPLGTVNEGGGWGASTFGPQRKELAREKTENAVDELKGGIGEDPENTIPYLYMDTDSTAWGDLEGAETMIRGKGFRPLGVQHNDKTRGFEYMQMKVFWYW